ncbi:hypothetical protein BKI52_23220 [marine bacterium AO1-C]|nr:hypothetical protein BKI52_23220 [marine bacterium AO1-C]
MKYLLIALLCLYWGSAQAQNVVTRDIDNFWNAYDKITATQDSARQMELLHQHFLDKGTPGLAAIRQARRYTPQQYLNAINRYPKFWKSIRANTYKSKTLSKELEKGIVKLKKVYPTLKPAKIYFTMGVFRTNGTTLDSAVLIGSELAMADKSIITEEFPARTKRFLDNYFSTDPISNIVFLNIHEYVHTQQKTAWDSNLFIQSLREGIAEFVAVRASGEKSYSPAIAYGKQNDALVKARFKKEMFNQHYRYWLWSSMDNAFKHRDLGYYIGYAIADKYYQKSTNKLQAIQDLVTLDLTNEKAVRTLVEKSGYFADKLSTLRKKYEQNRPQVVKIQQLKNGSKNVNPNLKRITVEFSKRMDTRFRGFDYGPLGESNVLRVQKWIGFSEDGKSVTFEVSLKPNQVYQVKLSNRFYAEDGTELAPYLIEFKTSK